MATVMIRMLMIHFGRDVEASQAFVLSSFLAVVMMIATTPKLYTAAAKQ